MTKQQIADLYGVTPEMMDAVTKGPTLHGKYTAIVTISGGEAGKTYTVPYSVPPEEADTPTGEEKKIAARTTVHPSALEAWRRMMEPSEEADTPAVVERKS